jgi:NitT/TauT family transport system substrate-binding protein
VVVVIAAGAAGVWDLAANGGTREEVAIGLLPQESAALVYIAQDRGYFADNGLNVTFRNASSGAAAVREMETGRTELSVTGEFPIVAEALDGRNVSILGCIDRHRTVVLVGRSENGTAAVADLKGKRVGVPAGSQSQFILGRFLDLHGLGMADVTMVDVPVSQAGDALANGSVEACVVMASDTARVRKQAGGPIVAWAFQENQPIYQVVAGRSDWIAARPGTVERLLRSLARAEDFAVQYPDEATAVVGRRLNLTDAYRARMGPQNQFGLSLDRSMLTAMTDEARWMVANRLTNATTVPDLRPVISTTGLERVRPGAVTIV